MLILEKNHMARYWLMKSVILAAIVRLIYGCKIIGVLLNLLN